MTADLDGARRRAILAALPRRIVAAGALIRDRRGRVLVVEPTYKPVWEIPGGVVEAGEAPRDAATRECFEELGIDVPIGRLLVLDHQVAPCDRGDAMMFVYDGGILDDAGDIRLDGVELASYRFLDFADAAPLLGPEKAARIGAAIAALADGSTAELIDSARPAR